MKKSLIIFLTFITVATLAFLLISCGKSTNSSNTEGRSDGGSTPTIVKSISDSEDDSGSFKDLQISSVILYEDGSVLVQTRDKLQKNEAENIYPFKDSGKVKDIYIINLGDQGHRTVVALMQNGSISAMSAKSLIEDHISVVRDDILGRDDFTKIENSKDQNGYYTATAFAKDGSKYSLDFSLDF